jgi:DNA mismatch endonuclease (patch repair protein)
VDTFSNGRRSEIMSRIKGKDTAPEMVVRSLLHILGFRFRLYRRDLPGCPDLLLPKHHAAVFIHGCFWHQHPGCRRSTSPKTREEWWANKLRRNFERDQSNQERLTELGWRVIVLWEYEIKRNEGLEERLVEFLGRVQPPRE